MFDINDTVIIISGNIWYKDIPGIICDKIYDNFINGNIYNVSFGNKMRLFTESSLKLLKKGNLNNILDIF